jgi:trehalose 6-phosphate synthase
MRQSGDMTTERPIVVAANRLPVMRTPDGDWTPSPGGLVRALLPMLRQSGGTWVGWTGDIDDDAAPFELDGVELHPVPLTQADHDDYYEGFANDSLWPLYHDAVRDSTFNATQWEAYVTVNERFAETIVKVAPPDATIWIHDYHLQLVPSMIREQRPDARVGFFLHIPFPPWELYARLPWRTEIIEGMLGADLLGFQRRTDAHNFATNAQQLAGVEIDGNYNVGQNVALNQGDTEPMVLTRDGAPATNVGVFPISIDVEEFDDLASERSVRRTAAALRASLGNPEVILLGVDRLDYTKGIGLRMKAFRSLLDDGTLDAERCVMVQVATPTREAVEHYQDERHEVERLVGEINGRHARIGHPVLHYLYRGLSIEDLVALYLAGDVMLVTPLRDGMNLVAKEYVASRRDINGVLVLSEFAGAADELTEAVLVNPHDEHALRDAIVQAVEMRHHERTRRMAELRAVVTRSDVRGWAENFLGTLHGRSPRPESTIG